MKLSLVLITLCTVAAVSPSGRAASGIPAFYGDPPDDHHPWAVHDPNRPQPKVVAPGALSGQEQPGKPPADAIVLFDGTDTSKWMSESKGGPAKWQVKDALLIVAPSTGDIRTREEFGDCQLHVEWSEPADVKGSSQGRGNSGIFLMGICEVQVLDSYNNITYADGHAASVYGVNPPMVNALRPPGEFQVYEIIFRRPIYKDGKPLDPGYVTVFVNGVLVQDHTQLEGPTGHMRRTHAGPFPEKGPLKLQDHGNPVRFRNIWYRPLPPRAVEGGTDGLLTTEATMAKRKQIAAELRQDAAHLQNVANPLPEMLRLMESLEYDKDAATMQKVEQMAGTYVASLRQLPADKLASKKDEAKQVNGDFQFLVRFNILPASFAPKVELETLIKEQKWDKR
jgi:prepilin-type processing-associated H-X9-DG protein